MHKVPKWSGTKNEAREKPDTHSRVSPSGGGGGGGSAPTSQNFDKSPLTKLLSLPINVPLHLVWHPLPSISQSSPIIWYI